MSREILVYRPQPVYIPEKAGVVREPLRGRDWHGRFLDEGQRSRFDARTLFYDMFFESGDLVLLGPPLLNLGLPVSMHCEGTELRFRNETTPLYAMPSLLRAELQAPQDRERLKLEFRFRDFTVSADCDLRRAQPPRLPDRRMALVTLQKDNPAEWLRDWLLWHHRVHGVLRAVIYDNGSQYFPELGRLLAGLDEDLEVILVHWPFPYGPIGVPDSSGYCQHGALNHFRLFFGADVRWGLNLDVDEYLYQPQERNGPSLEKYLAQPEVCARPVVYLGSWFVPANAGRAGDAKTLPRFFHYSVRCREDRFPFWAHHKYMFQPGRVTVCGTHEAFVPTAGLQTLKKMWKNIWRKMRAWLLSLSGGRRDSRIADNPLEQAPYVHSDMSSRTREFLFLHFRGLYSGWMLPQDEERFRDSYQMGGAIQRWRPPRDEKRLRDAEMKRRIAAAKNGGSEKSGSDADDDALPPDWLTEEPGVMQTAVRVGLAPSSSERDPRP